MAARPHVILTRDEAIPVLNQILAVPTTTVVRAIPTEVWLDEEDGMPRPCVVSLDNTTSIVRAFCTERITRLSPAKMAEVCAALSRATAC